MSQAEVDAKATAVRELKAAKASPEVIKTAVDDLLDAKARFKASTEVVSLFLFLVNSLTFARASTGSLGGPNTRQGD
jgi:hypothetical protein